MMKNLKVKTLPSFAPNLDHQIERSAQYLIEKNQRDAEENKAQYGHQSLLAELDSVRGDIASAVNRLGKLSVHFAAGPILTTDFNKLGWSSPNGVPTLGMGPFVAHEKRLLRTLHKSQDALAEIIILISEVKIFHTRKTRALDLQKSATRLAYAIVGDRIRGQARTVAIRIMDKANLGNPDKSSLTGWLKEFREEGAELLRRQQEESE